MSRPTVAPELARPALTMLSEDELAFRDALRERTKSIPDNNHIRGGHDAA